MPRIPIDDAAKAAAKAARAAARRKQQLQRELRLGSQNIQKQKDIDILGRTWFAADKKIRILKDTIKDLPVNSPRRKKIESQIRGIEDKMRNMGKKIDADPRVKNPNNPLAKKRKIAAKKKQWREAGGRNPSGMAGVERREKRQAKTVREAYDAAKRQGPEGTGGVRVPRNPKPKKPSGGRRMPVPR